jgi:hypothetical protein
VTDCYHQHRPTEHPQPPTPPRAQGGDDRLDFGVDSEPSCQRAPGASTNDGLGLIIEDFDASEKVSVSGSDRAVVVVRSRWRRVISRSRFAALAVLVLGVSPPNPELAEPAKWTPAPTRP